MIITAVNKISSEPNKALELFKEVLPANKGLVLLSLSRHLRDKIIKSLSMDEIIEIVKFLDPTKTTDFLQEIDKKYRSRIIKNLRKDLKKKVEFLFKFDPKTAGGLMSLDFIIVENDETFSDVAEVVRKHEERTGRFPAILVMDEGRLVGELPGFAFALNKSSEKIKNHTIKPVTVLYNSDSKTIIRLFKKTPHSKIIVLDEDNDVLGVIYSDEIMRVIDKSATNNLYGFAGVREDEDVCDSPMVKIKNRYSWLILHLFTSMLAASVIVLFEDTLASMIVLAAFLPVIAGMGGNAGTQTMAVMVRSLALGEQCKANIKKILFNEVLSSLANGLINGSIIAVIALLSGHTPLLGLIVGGAMIINLVIAGVFGTIIPLFMKGLGKDPASSSVTIITGATDFFGFLSLLGLASILLK